MIKALSFDDVLLQPSFSYLESREEPVIEGYVGNISLPLPILSAPMDTVTEGPMALFMYEMGGLGVIHRFNTIDQQYVEVRWAKEMGAKVGAAIGINGDSFS